MRNEWPQRDTDGTPIGSTKDDETGRLLVEATQARVVDTRTDDAIEAGNELVSTNRAILDMLTKINAKLAHIAGVDPGFGGTG